MKILTDFMDMAAKQRSYSSFKDFSNHFRLGAEGEMVLSFMIEVADKYAMCARGEGFEEAREECKSIVDNFGKDIISEDIEEINNPYKRYM